MKSKVSDQNNKLLLDLNEFSDYLDVAQVSTYAIELLDDDGAIKVMLSFYDNNGDLVKVKS